jgi:hypothetical protein
LFPSIVEDGVEILPPHEDFDWTGLDSITLRTRNYTWQSAGARYCIERGFQVRWFETFDYARFSEQGYSYLRELFGPEIAERKVPSREDLLELIASGWLSICNVNACILHVRAGVGLPKRPGKNTLALKLSGPRKG